MLGYLIKQLFFDIILIFLILYVEFIPLLSCKEVLINTIKELLNNTTFKLMPHRIGDEGFPMDHIPNGQGSGGGGDSPPNGNSNPNGTNGTNGNGTNGHRANYDHATRASNRYDTGHFRPPNSMYPINNEIVRVEVEEGRRALNQFLSRNLNQNTIHSVDTLRHRAEAIQSRSILNNGSYGSDDSPAHYYHMNIVDSYNSWLRRSNPPFLNETI